MNDSIRDATELRQVGTDFTAGFIRGLSAASETRNERRARERADRRARRKTTA